MRERHIFFDIAPVLLLMLLVAMMGVLVLQNKRGWAVMQGIKEQQKVQAATLNDLVRKMGDVARQPRRTVPYQQRQQTSSNLQNGSTANRANNDSAAAGTADAASVHPLRPDLPPDAEPQKLFKVVRGDEKANDGDHLILSTAAEPNSLNPIIDNDAFVGTLFGLANDDLAARSWDDLNRYEPRLAKGWTKELLCIAYPKDGDAKRLAKDIRARWDASVLSKLNIKTIVAGKNGDDDVVQIKINAVNNDYGAKLTADFGDRVAMQSWFFINFQGQEFLDGKKVTSVEISSRARAAITSAPGFKGRILAPILREDSIILRVLGDPGTRKSAHASLKAWVASKKNRCQVLDKGSVSGKREEQCYFYDVSEEYIAQEKPIFTFYLREDVKWHDGQAFDGNDVVFSFNTIKNPEIEAGPLRSYLNDCASVKLVDNNKYIVRFTWIKPYFGAFSATAGLSLIPEHLFKFKDPTLFNTGPQNQKLIGTGSYRLETWERNKKFVLVRNENYYGRKPHFKKVVYKIIKDTSVQLKLLELEKIDLYGMRPTQWETKKKNVAFRKKCNISISIANAYYYVGWNARTPYFNDTLTRQALTMLIDRKRICEDVYRGYAIPQHGPIHPEAPAYWKGIEAAAWPFDPKAAALKLAKAGWRDSDGDGVLDRNGKSFRFTLMIRANSPEHESMANLIKASCQKVGIVVTINNLEWSAFLQKIERLKFDACILGWRLAVESDPYQLWHSSQTDEKESNYCKFVNKDADSLIERCRRELNPARRKVLLEKFQRIILREQPYTFLMVTKRLNAYHKRIKNVKYNLFGSDTSRWWVPVGDQKY